MLDSSLKPWLLEINTSPSLSSSSPLDKTIKTSLVSDLFSLIGFTVKPSIKYLKGSSPNKTKTISKKSIDQTKERAKIRNRKTEIISDLLKAKKDPQKMTKKKKEDLIFKMIEEDYRKGDFEKIFPLATNFRKYKKFFKDSATLNDKVIWKWLANQSSINLSHNKVIHQTAV